MFSDVNNKREVPHPENIVGLEKFFLYFLAMTVNFVNPFQITVLQFDGLID
jgi:hypothetical protein